MLESFELQKHASSHFEISLKAIKIQTLEYAYHSF